MWKNSSQSMIIKMLLLQLQFLNIFTSSTVGSKMHANRTIPYFIETGK